MGKDVTTDYAKYLITQNFDIDENDIKDWTQDILDEHSDLDLLVTLHTKNKFYIYFFNDKMSNDRTYKTNYTIDVRHIKFINERLRERGCCLVNYYTEFDSFHDPESLIKYNEDKIILKVVTFDYLRYNS